MATSYKILGQANFGNVNTTLYTVPTGKQSTVSSITFICGDTGAGNYIRIHAVKSGQSIGLENMIYRVNSAEYLGSYSFSDGITLAAGESIQVRGNTAGESNQTATVFGCEMDA